MSRRPRPDPPGPGQRSVWDFPRPPALERSSEHVVVRFAGEKVADTRAPWLVCETSHPPVYYVPRDDVRWDLLEGSPRRTYCEFKGVASYADLAIATDQGTVRSLGACWWYDAPTPRFLDLAGAVAFYPQLVDACEVASTHFCSTGWASWVSNAARSVVAVASPSPRRGGPRRRGRLLRRVDHLQGQRPVQGRAGYRVVVSAHHAAAHAP